VSIGVEVTVDGRAPTGGGALSVRIASRLSQPTQCEVTFDTEGTDPAWPLGGRLVVRAAGDEEVFDGDVTGVEYLRGPDGTAVHRLRGYDRLHRLRRRRQLRVFEDVTVAELAEALTAGLGITVQATEPGPRAARLVQHRQNDLELLTSVAARAGLYTAMRGDTLRLVSLEGHGDPVKLHYRQSLWEVRIEANVDRPADRYTAFGWDPQGAEQVREEATAPRSGRRIELRPDQDGTEWFLVDGYSGDVAGAAQAALDVSDARAVTLDGLAEGDAALCAGARVELSGVASDVDGGYALCEAVHTVDGTGWLTRLSTRPPAVPIDGPPSVSTITLGRVTAVADPEKRGRVRVSLPAHGDPDIGWLAVLCLGAGAGRGLVLLPDVGDPVLVALPHGFNGEGIVLGSLYGAESPPDSGVEGESVRRWSLHTADGQSIVVDDAAHSIRLADRGGSLVELTPDLVRLHANTDLTIEAPGHAVTVRAATVDFVQASSPEEA
jgi:uncharacterized protein involved in type VI secretion and phage assembly